MGHCLLPAVAGQTDGRQPESENAIASFVPQRITKGGQPANRRDHRLTGTAPASREARPPPFALHDHRHSLSRQQISRRRSHLSRLDKDCYYVQFIQNGNLNVLQSGATLSTNAGIGALFCASEPYDLQCLGKIRS
jgi:hypothetical protein